MFKSYAAYIIKHYFFWLSIFFINRWVFLLFNWSKLSDVSIWEILQTFQYGIYLDNATISYIVALPVILVFIQSLTNSYIITPILKYYTLLIIVLNAIITSAELPLFDDWGVKINYKALQYLANPSEVLKTASFTETAMVLILITIQIVLFFSTYKRLVLQVKTIEFGKKWVVNPLLFLLFAFLIGTGLRGGLQPIPINQSDVYFSKIDIINTSSVNSAWNLIHSYTENFSYMGENPYTYYPIEEARKIVNNIQQTKNDSTISILKTTKPNVVMLILESWSADCVNGIDGYFEGITPFYDSLANDGILFTNCYGSGFRSEQGMVALFSGFPAQPNTSIIKQKDKFSKLPCINTGFNKAEYHTSFLFGGQLSYGNIKSYMYFNQFDKIAEEVDFDENTPSGRLGVHDEFMLKQLHNDINTYKEPFFAAAFTCSSHPPYDHPPLSAALNFGEGEQDFYNSIKYSDESLKQFFKDVKNEPWYDNTLFVLVADHGHNTSKNWRRNSAAYKKIAMMFYGNVIKEGFKGKPYTKICGQSDLPKTLLNQLGMKSDKFYWSNDLYNPSRKEYAFHSFENGVGWITPYGTYGYEHSLDKVIENTLNDSTRFNNIEIQAKSYLQVLFEDYLNY